MIARNRMFLAALVAAAAFTGLSLGGCPSEPSEGGGLTAWLQQFNPDTSSGPEPTSVEVSVSAPTDAGVGQSAALTATVGGSGDFSGMTYRWLQTSGPAVDLLDDTTIEATFVAPSLRNAATLGFRFDARTPRGVVTSGTVVVAVPADPDFGAGGGDDGGTGTEQFPRVRLETSKGDIVVELNREAAPLTVNNFLRYLDDGDYDGTIFHRVIKDFVVQGGGFDPDLTQRETRDPIRSEADNGLRNDRGTIAMARTTDPDSATSQFYFNLVNNDSLNASDSSPGYTVFGRVVEGLDIVDEISGVETGSEGGFTDVPVTDVLLERAVRIQS